MKAQMERIFGMRRSRDEGEHWLSISDLMAGLMMAFLLISVALMRSAFIERDRIKLVAVTYRDSQISIYNALTEEFEDDLKRWKADIRPENLSFEFKSPEVLFKSGEVPLQPHFMEILDDFFPRYLTILENFADVIEEVRIEGHTSSDWSTALGEDEAYFKNMWLSQGRTRKVLEYVYSLPEIAEDRNWMKTKVATVGFSSSRPVTDNGGREDRDASRRVIFRVITNSETQIRRILAE